MYLVLFKAPWVQQHMRSTYPWTLPLDPGMSSGRWTLHSCDECHEVVRVRRGFSEDLE